MYASRRQNIQTRCRTPRLTRSSDELLSTRLVFAFTALAFAIVASIAATHLHAVPDEDAACAICTAFGGKLHDSGRAEAVCTAFLLIHPLGKVLSEPQRVGVAPTLPPPSCGPPAAA